MDAKYYVMLPTSLQRVVDEAESLIGRPIGIVPPPADMHSAFAGAKFDGVEITMASGTMCINLCELPGRTMSPRALAHEILHVRRNVVERQWRLVTRSGEITRTPANIENDLEHMAIVPEECELFPDAVASWEQIYADVFDELAGTRPSDDEAGNLGRRNDMLRHWITTWAILPQWSGRDRLASMMAEEGCYGDGLNLIRRYQRDGGDKAKAVATMIRFHKFRSDPFRLARFSVAERRIDYQDLPAR